jgi:hypothetical protein
LKAYAPPSVETLRDSYAWHKHLHEGFPLLTASQIHRFIEAGFRRAADVLDASDEEILATVRYLSRKKLEALRHQLRQALKNNS